MKHITEKQIDKINQHLSKMTEEQQDAYLQKLEEAGLINSILSKFGSAKNNLAKLQKQKTQISTQLNKMIQAINASQVQGISAEEKQRDVQALTNLKTKIDNLNLNIEISEEPAENNNGQ